MENLLSRNLVTLSCSFIVSCWSNWCDFVNFTRVLLAARVGCLEGWKIACRDDDDQRSYQLADIAKDLASEENNGQ